MYKSFLFIHIKSKVRQFSLTDKYIYQPKQAKSIRSSLMKQNTLEAKMMKQSIIYGEFETGGDKECGIQQKSSMGSIGTNGLGRDLLQGVVRIMQHIAVKEERIQLLKEMLTTREDFNPQTLFSYLSQNEQQFDRRHLLLLLEENNVQSSQEEIKLYLNSYGYKDRLDYAAFINLIFPVDVNLLKYISITGIKKYATHSTLTQSSLYIYILLVKQEINSLLQIDQLKYSILSKVTRKQIKSLMRTIKKNGDCYSQMEIQSQALIKYEELKSLFKNLHNKYNKPTAVGSAKKHKRSTQANKQKNSQIYSFLQKNSVCIFRKLSMGKSNFINLQDFEFWLRPWPRLRSLSINIGQCSPCFSNVFEISRMHEIGQAESHASLGGNVKVPLSHAY